MIFLEKKKKKKKKKKKTRYTSAAEGVQVFGKFVVVIEVNEREFFQRSSVYSWKCGKCKCGEREGRTREHIFGDFKIFLFLFSFFFLTKRLDSLFETPLFTTYMRSHMRVVVVLDYYLPTRFSTTTTTNNNNE